MKLETYIEKYECGSCDTLYDDEDEAQDCCAPHVRCVLVCSVCQKQFSEYKTKEAAACHPEGTADRKCLCGTILQVDDEEPSLRLGSLIWCAECREQIEAGVPAPVARDRTFARLAGIATA